MDSNRGNAGERVPGNQRSMFALIALVLLAGIGVARITSTYHVFNQTTDEPAHLVTGLEWIQRGAYTLEPLHPPLARITIALGPYLSGLRLTGLGRMWQEGDEILLSHQQYLHNLALARLGVLPFFLLATVSVWYWSRLRYGNGPAVIATFLFTTSPVVLAHAGLATTDMAVTATFTAFLIAFISFLERPTCLRSIILGLAVGLATLSKFSAVVFMPACGLALLIFRWLLSGNKEDRVAADQLRWTKGLTLTGLAMLLVIWAGYRFSITSVTNAAARPHPTIDRVFGGRGSLHDWAYVIAESPVVPAPAFFRGLAEMRQKNADGHKGYLLGHTSQTGWWYFFPVALAVKTTIPFMILIVGGSFYLVKRSWLEKDWIAGAPVIMALALLLVCMPSHINIGVRHILPIYPLFSIIGAGGACRLWGSTKYVASAGIVAFLVWHLSSSIRVHPDYLAYFNELAGDQPEHVLVDSDLDWGQDLLRLSVVLKQRHIDELSIAYAGSSDLDLRRFGLPPFKILAAHQPTTGWIAVSLLRLKVGGFGFPSDSFSWLEAYRPVCLVGKSIRLYYLPSLAKSNTKRSVSQGRRDTSLKCEQVECILARWPRISCSPPWRGGHHFRVPGENFNGDRSVFRITIRSIR